ncbi:hypothetical protein Efla_000791 [Eimeria flavescens]
MAGRGGANANDAVPFSFVAADFVASRILPSSKAVPLSLIKVPKFVAESWRSAASAEAVVGVLSEENGKQVLVVRDPATGGACKLEALSLANELALVLQRNGKHLLDVISELTGRTNFQPKLDPLYQKVRGEQKMVSFCAAGRGTVEEMRRDPGLDSLHTLFQFYTPKAPSSSVLEDGGKRGAFESAARAKAKQRKGALMDSDSLKVRLFKMFEAAGTAGLQLKQIAAQTQQPLSHVKTVVEEIAEQRKRMSDRKSVYFLKPQYNIQSDNVKNTLLQANRRIAGGEEAEGLPLSL